jgi:cytochrome b561
MQARYSRLNQALHWFTAACMFAILPLGWVMVNAKEGTPLSSALFNWHKTLGAIVLIVTAFRIVWRFVDPPPAYPPKVAAADHTLAQIAYWLFFALMIFMPVTGILGSAYGGHPLKLFNWIATPQPVAPDKGLGQFFTGLHLAGQWGIYALIVLHLGAVVLHVIWGKDGLLGRMLPASSVEPVEPRGPSPVAARATATAPRAPFARAR